MEVEPLLEASGKRILRSIMLTHDDAPPSDLDWDSQMKN